MDYTLARRLHGLHRRLRLFHTLWSLALVWIVFASLGYWLWTIGGKNDGVPALWFQAWVVGGIACAFLCCWWARRSFKNLASVATHVENCFPSLNQRLVTAAGLRPSGTDGRFTYLQRSVIAEALHHDVKNQWTSIVPTPRLIALALANVPALLAVVGMGWMLWRTPQIDVAPLSSVVKPSQILPPEVVPGHTEVKKGSSLIVTAKFPGKLPSQVWLVRQSLAGDAATSSAARIPTDKMVMKQSLGDPLFAAYVNDISEPFEYRIEYDREASTNYSVTVFECPEVVRTDAQLSYPLYTQLDPKEVVDTRRVSAPIGSTLTWLVHLSKPIAKGALVPKSSSEKASGTVSNANSESNSERSDGETLNLQLDSTNPLVARCELEVKRSGEWLVQLTDADGRNNEISVTLRLNALANKEPVLQLTSGGDATVSALQEFEVAAKVKDDYALTSAGIGYQMAGGELIERSLEIRQGSEKGKKESTITDIIDFESLKAEPDQLLSYYLWVEDLDERGEPRRVTSDIYFVEVRPFEEVFRQGDQSADQQEQQQQQSNQSGQQGGAGEELLELQKQIISASWNIARAATSKALPARASDDLAVVLESQEQAIEMLQEQAAEAPPGSDAAIAEAERAMNGAVEALARAGESLSKADLANAIAAEQRAYQSLLKMQPRENRVSRQQRSQSSSQQSRRQQSRQQQLDQLELEDRENRYQDQRRAQEEEQSPSSETRQIASRLRELAMRQQDLNQQLRDVEAALQAAETQEQREELEQRLERLRQQQQQILEDADELQQRLQESQNAEMQQAQQQMEQTRQDLQQANQALRENNTGQALAAGARAQEQLEQLREDVRQQAANQFGEAMQEMRSASDELQQRQQQLVEKLQPKDEQPSTGLRDPQQRQDGQARELAKEQQQQLSELLEQMQQTIEQAEESEPLLAQKLFDGYRRTQQERVEEQLQLTERLLQRDFNQEAGQLAGETLEDLKALGNDISAAADSVLGSDLESMRLALNQLDVARQQVESEIARATGREPGDQPTPSGDQPAQSGEGRVQPENGQLQRDNEPNQSGDQAAQRGGEQSSEQAPSGQRQPGQQQGQQSEQQSGGQPGQQPAGRPGLRGNEPSEPGQRPNDDTPPGNLGGGSGSDRVWRDAAPITGDDFRTWSDRLREVEELVTDPELRWEATRIRQTARQLRSDWQRTARAPRWSDVEDLVAAPLRDLQRKVSQELMRRAAERTDIVPVDRDPVPSQYRELVREYYERLGKGK